MPHGQCTAPATGQHRTASGRERCPTCRTGAGSSQGKRTSAPPTWPTVDKRPVTEAAPKVDYNARYGLIERLSTSVLDLVQKKPDELLRSATLALIDSFAVQHKRPPRGEHMLCQVFEQFAVGLQSLMDIPNQIVEDVVPAQVGGSEILSYAVRALLRHATRLAAANSLAPLSVLHLKACICAVAFCPKPEGHRSLEANCEVHLVNALDDE